jgi:hypothetical protein
MYMLTFFCFLVLCVCLADSELKKVQDDPNINAPYANEQVADNITNHQRMPYKLRVYCFCRRQ